MGKAGSKRRRIVLGIVTLATVLTGILVLLVHPSAVTTNTYIDANRGDVRVETTVCGLRVRDTVSVTRFSREVRRLGITVRHERDWRPVLVEEGLLLGTHIDFRLTGTAGDLELLIDIFEQGKVSDEERLVILQRILVSLKKLTHGEREIREQVAAMENAVYEEAK